MNSKRTQKVQLRKKVIDQNKQRNGQLLSLGEPTGVPGLYDHEVSRIKLEVYWDFFRDNNSRGNISTFFTSCRHTLYKGTP